MELRGTDYGGKESENIHWHEKNYALFYANIQFELTYHHFNLIRRRLLYIYNFTILPFILPCNRLPPLIGFRQWIDKIILKPFIFVFLSTVLLQRKKKKKKFRNQFSDIYCHKYKSAPAGIHTLDWNLKSSSDEKGKELLPEKVIHITT